MRTQKERMEAGDLFLPDDPEFARMNRRNRLLVKEFNQTTVDELDQRSELLCNLIPNIGKQAYIEPPFYCEYGNYIKTGDNFFANLDCIFMDIAPITIGHNVLIGPRVGIYTANHPLDVDVRSKGVEYGQAVTIGDNVWIGAGAILNPGVTIGSNTVIGSGAVVTKDIPDNVLAAGNPCQVIRTIGEEDYIKWQRRLDDYLEEMGPL